MKTENTTDRLSAAELSELKLKLPVDWVAKIQGKVPYGATKIREAMRDPNKYDGAIIGAAIEVAQEYLALRNQSIQKQKELIAQLSAS